MVDMDTNDTVSTSSPTMRVNFHDLNAENTAGLVKEAIVDLSTDVRVQPEERLRLLHDLATHLTTWTHALRAQMCLQSSDSSS